MTTSTHKLARSLVHHKLKVIIVSTRIMLASLYTQYYRTVRQEVKGLKKKLYFVLLSRRKTSFYAKFQVNCLPFLHGCGLHYNVRTIGNKRLTTNYITMHYPGRKPVYLQIFEFIGAMVSEFRFFMRLRTLM